MPLTLIALVDWVLVRELELAYAALDTVAGVHVLAGPFALATFDLNTSPPSPWWFLFNDWPPVPFLVHSLFFGLRVIEFDPE